MTSEEKSSKISHGEINSTKDKNSVILEFTQETSFHGLKYIGDSRLHWTNRLFWICVFAFSLVSCTMIVFKTHQKLHSNPIILTSDEKVSKISEIPFPAVTICSEVKTSDTEMFKRVQNLIENFSKSESQVIKHYFNEEDRNYVDALSNVCMRNNIEFLFRKFGRRSNDTWKPTNFVAAMRRMGMTNQWTLNRPCLFDDSPIYCQFETLTDEGFCWTFNSLSTEDLYKIEK